MRRLAHGDHLLRRLQGACDRARGHDFIQIWWTGHLAAAVLICWTACSVLLYVIQRFRDHDPAHHDPLGNLRSRALAFAGNDLVNFIGVPVAGFDAYLDRPPHGRRLMLAAPSTRTSRPTSSSWPCRRRRDDRDAVDSKKSMHVSATELSAFPDAELVRRPNSSTARRSFAHERPRRAQHHPPESNGSSPRRSRHGDRQTVRNTRTSSTAAPLRHDPRHGELTTSARHRAGTSLKPLPPRPIVSFMVAMGSSLADWAWGRESAAAISGVMTVVAGWFVTALGGFLIAFVDWRSSTAASRPSSSRSSADT